MRDEIIEKAKEFGASLVGLADVKAIKESPAHLIYGKLHEFRGVGTTQSGRIRPKEVAWPEGAKSAIVFGVEHPEDELELDWWQEGYRGGTAGNHNLITINDKLSSWLEERKGIGSKKLPYYIERGGIFLKDAAVMAGLGCIGKNNMLVTPEFGPRVRLRALFTFETLPSMGPIDFDPCEDCPVPCREACPQEALGTKIYSSEEFGQNELPARTGLYNRDTCNVQMELDIDNSERTDLEGRNEPARVIKYCRKCELACPVGKPIP